MSRHSRRKPIALYIDIRDIWVGYYNGEYGHYICLLPMVVIRIRKRPRKRPAHGE